MINDTLWVDQCLGIYPDQILEKAKQQRPSRVVILGEFEWDMPVLTKEFVDELKLIGAELHLIHCGFPCQYYTDRYTSFGIDMKNVIFWKTHWLNYSMRNLIHIDIEKQNQNNTNKYPFISLNNRSHIHRCALIDELSERNLIDKGVVSWVAHLNENPNYPFRHFDRNRRIYLGDNFEKEFDSFLIPKQFHESFLHVITEATLTVPLISEKVVKPILFKKPFLTLGIHNWNDTLRELGFQLYDEIFDYEYDKFEDLNQRTRMLVDNIDRIIDKDLDQLYKILEPKIEYNYQRCLEIIKDKNYIPFIVKHRLALSQAQFVNFTSLDTKYQQFMDMTV